MGTFNYELVELLGDAGRYELDADTATIRCLSHVVNLAVLELLVVLKVVKKTDVREDIIDIGDLTEEEAEEIGADDFAESEKDDEAVLDEQAREGEEIDGSVFAKVRHHKSHLSPRHIYSHIFVLATMHCQAHTFIFTAQGGLCRVHQAC